MKIDGFYVGTITVSSDYFVDVNAILVSKICLTKKNIS
jgi:hypothetical protein